MPNKPMRPCSKTGCRELTTDTYCAAHKKDARTYDNNRESAAKRGYDSQWRKARLGWLRKHPLCAEHERQGYVVQATEVDHIIPHKGDKDLFWDSTNNWQSLCKSCHSAKTVREDGGWAKGRG